MTEGPLLEARDVVKRFGSVIALSGVSLKVQAGEVHCLLGDNGAGKSTLIKTLSGVHRPTQGQLLVKGEPVDFDSPRDLFGRGGPDSRRAHVGLGSHPDGDGPEMHR